MTNWSGLPIRLRGSVVLDHVELYAFNQRIIGNNKSGMNELTLKNGVNYHGIVMVYANETQDNGINLHLEGSSWTVSGDSNLLEGALTLDAASVLNFVTDSNEFDFFNLATARVHLEAGSVLNLDQESTRYEVGDVLDLFICQNFVNEGCLLVTSDGVTLEYISSDNGSFVLAGSNTNMIPEPSTAGIALFGLTALLGFRRRTLS